MKLCLNRGTAGREMTLEQFVALAREAGFSGADVDMRYAEQHGVAALQDLYAGTEMAFGGWGAPADIRADEAKFKEGLAKLPAWAKAAATLNIDSCATYLLPSSHLPLWENWQFHVARLKPIARVLSDHGLRFGLEFVSPYHLRRKFRHEFIFTPGQMLELADAVGENVGLLVDTFHCHCAGTPWSEIAALDGRKVVLVHLNDANDLPLKDQDDVKRLTPGDGVLDLVGFLNALKTAGYGGPVSVEVFNEQLRKLPAEKAARHAADGSRRAFTAAGL